MNAYEKARKKRISWQAEFISLDREIRYAEQRLSQLRKQRRAARAGVERADATCKRLVLRGDAEYGKP
jgi:uncharacterized coiled-coil DUF342 family protein